RHAPEVVLSAAFQARTPVFSLDAVFPVRRGCSSDCNSGRNRRFTFPLDGEGYEYSEPAPIRSVEGCEARLFGPLRARRMVVASWRGACPDENPGSGGKSYRMLFGFGCRLRFKLIQARCDNGSLGGRERL